MRRKVALASLLLFAHLANPALAGRAQFASALSRDLDGDGKAEKIEFAAPRMAGGDACCEFSIAINGHRSPVFHGVSLTGEIAVVDIDSTDNLLELAVPEYGPSDDYAVHFFRYVQGRLVAIGDLPGSMQPDWRTLLVDGSGVVRTRCRGKILQTWFYPCMFKVSSAGTFERLHEATYPMNTELTMLQELHLVSRIGDTNPSVTLRPGDKITVLCSDDERWCQVETHDGRVGWFEVLAYDKLADGRHAGEVFKGLSIAD